MSFIYNEDMAGFVAWCHSKAGVDFHAELQQRDERFRQHNGRGKGRAKGKR